MAPPGMPVTARLSAAARRVADADLGALNVDELTDLVVELTAERARVEGRYLAAVGEMTSRYGAQAMRMCCATRRA